MNKFLLTLLIGLTALFSAGARAEPVVAESVEAAKAAAEVKCVKACLILDELDIAVLSAQIDAALEQAYKAGVAGWSKAAALGTN